MKFSILMASYNNGKYISDAIESLINQTYSNWELIIVDDFSSDNSVNIISFFLGDPRIKFFENDKNYGCGYTKKRCAEIATGEIIGELDPDDFLEKSAIKEMIKAHKENYDCGFIYSTHYECDQYLNVKKINRWISEPNFKITNLKKHTASQFRTYKKNVYDKTSGFSENMKKAVDMDLIYKIEEITKLKFINKPLYYYRKHKNGISLGANNFEAKAWDICAKFNAYKRRRKTNIPNFSKKQISYLLLEGSLRFLFSRNIKMFFYLFARGIKFSPFYFLGLLTLFKKIIIKKL